MKYRKYDNPEAVGYLGWLDFKGVTKGFVRLDGSIQTNW